MVSLERKITWVSTGENIFLKILRRSEVTINLTRPHKKMQASEFLVHHNHVYISMNCFVNKRYLRVRDVILLMCRGHVHDRIVSIKNDLGL